MVAIVVGALVLPLVALCVVQPVITVSPLAVDVHLVDINVRPTSHVLSLPGAWPILLNQAGRWMRERLSVGALRIVVYLWLLELLEAVF